MILQYEHWAKFGILYTVHRPPICTCNLSLSLTVMTVINPTSLDIVIDVAVVFVAVLTTEDDI